MSLKFEDNNTDSRSERWFWERVREAIVSYPVLNLGNTQFQGRIAISLDADGKEEYVHEHVCPQFNESYLLSQGWQFPLTIVDVGANVGAFTWLAAMMGEDVYAYEPAQETFERLQKNISRYSLKAENVAFFRNAVAAESGQTVYLTKSKTSDFSGDARTSATAGEECEEVPTISLEDIIARTPRKKIDYLKVDCEGAEYDFLLGKDLSQVGYLVLELHEVPGKDAANLLSHIESTHRIKWIGSHNILATNFALEKSYGYLGYMGTEKYFGHRYTFEEETTALQTRRIEANWQPLDQQIFEQLNPLIGQKISSTTLPEGYRRPTED